MSWEKAGKITAQMLLYGKELIKPDASLLDVATKIEDKIKEKGGFPAFPVNISINDIAAHYTPYPEDKLKFKKGDLVKLDIGVSFDGFLGDSAITIDLGDNKDLVKVSEEALKAAIEIAKPNTKICELGKVIETTITNLGFKPIRNLSGHSMEINNLHAGLNIPNYENNNQQKLIEGQIIAIEPFATTKNGSGLIQEEKESSIYMQIANKNIRDFSAKKLLTEINKFNGLPFAKRWFNYPVNRSLNILKRESIIMEYGHLVEKNKALVSQAEHTIKVGTGILTKI